MGVSLEHLNTTSPTVDYLSMYRLRYNTYCIESKFLNAQEYPNEFECDDYDNISEHFVLKKDNIIIGTVRLIKWSDKLQFPTTLYYPILMEKLNSLKFPIQTTAEISRLCLIKKYRKDPLNILEIFRGMYQTCEKVNITNLFGSFEVTLYRLLRQLGIYFTPISNNIEYYGKVKVYSANLIQLKKDLISNRPDLINFFIN
jgi:N-acyl-L-homoserine lactone synthetase